MISFIHKHSRQMAAATDDGLILNVSAHLSGTLRQILNDALRGKLYFFTVKTPFIPTAQWPGKLQRNG